MDETRCPNCNNRMTAVMAANGRTEFRCSECDLIDPDGHCGRCGRLTVRAGD
jgi:tRNA(Ile2) C34 agmatinyltransferase TiaS